MIHRWLLAEVGVVLADLNAGHASSEDAARSLEHLAVLLRAGAVPPVEVANLESRRRGRLIGPERRREQLSSVTESNDTGRGHPRGQEGDHGGV